MLLKVLAYWLRFLQLLAIEGEGGEGEAEGAAGEAEGEGEAAETTLDDFLDETETKLGGKPKGDEDESPAEKRAREASERAEAAERRAADAERRARDLETSRPAPTGADPEYQREEAMLADARSKNQDTTWLQWKIDIERGNRGLRLDVQRERALAADARDAAQFERIESTHPKLFSKYRDRVEQWRQESAKNGQQPAPRLAILDLLIGNDMRNGKLKVKTKTRTTETVDKRLVDRGATPRARSDVDRKQRLTDAEKRRERLRGQLI